MPGIERFAVVLPDQRHPALWVARGKPYNSQSESTLARKGSTGSAARPRGPARGRDEGVRPPRVFALGADPIREIESRARSIRDPVAKLRYVRRSLERYETMDERFQAVPLAPVRWALYRMSRLERARSLFSSNPNGALNAPPRRPAAVAARVRKAANWAVGIIVVAAGLALAAYPRSGGFDGPATPLPPDSLDSPDLAPVAEHLSPATQGIPPEGIWLVDSGEGWELYSNGLRIDTTYAVPGEPRDYRVFTMEEGMGPGLHHRPIGLVFHTTESDIWPLEESYSEKLRDASQSLLRYLRRHQVYHYLIDRFGQAFRVVEEADRAHHSGMSIWEDGDRVFLNLNGATIGVSYETRWEGGRALPITRAQLESGRRLTDYLRAKWSIAADMCLTHGLISVNPHKHLIGHHVDWARGFPFEAYGLPDLYTRPAPAVALFGFGYDEPFLEVVGEPWPGVPAAERILEAEALETGRTVDEERRERMRLYDRWLDEHTRDARQRAREAETATRMARRNGTQGDRE